VITALLLLLLLFRQTAFFQQFDFVSIGLALFVVAALLYSSNDSIYQKYQYIIFDIDMLYRIVKKY